MRDGTMGMRDSYRLATAKGSALLGDFLIRGSGRLHGRNHAYGVLARGHFAEPSFFVGILVQEVRFAVERAAGVGHVQRSGLSSDIILQFFGDAIISVLCGFPKYGSRGFVITALRSGLGFRSLGINVVACCT